MSPSLLEWPLSLNYYVPTQQLYPSFLTHTHIHHVPRHHTPKTNLEIAIIIVTTTRQGLAKKVFMLVIG
jgi:hypothetical protein